MAQYILSGPPNGGKSAIGEKLYSLGYKVLEEAETPLLIRMSNQLTHERAVGIWNRDYTTFKGVVGYRQQRIDREAAGLIGEDIFRDRAAPCWIGYCLGRGAKVPRILTDLAKSTVVDTVFYFESQPIFNMAQNHGRNMDQETAQAIGGYIWDTYLDLGAHIVRIPSTDSFDNPLSIDKRTELVLAEIR